MADTLKQRPEFRNIHVTEIRNYRLPPAGIVSILHRVSGAILFVLLPFVVWLFDVSVTSEVSFESFRSAFVAGIGFVPGWFVKLVCLGLIWGYLHHFTAGVRHLWMDATHSVTKEQGRSSAIATLVISLALTVLLGAKLFGLY
ncbi:succinate dehydrogenase, cytochrome b556 subunit [Ideonella oryzae]|uniref:Succinate dehydrogenase cytochrome b556 subunit n=1 Tax=Ideonella oryzae TaxID=2937441 RepID=A0ABT1BJD6_9BURK|nr:succinate dehydrogenase, cytochrome b556 subunit [Ideonella oryzae]MCO5976223.1 succinate dehydrogenase, cytochrome b556 subunit [Ideonella oryzae]